jgi:hypothetical protein
MALAPIPGLTQVIGLNGTELIEVAQLQGTGPSASYVSRKATIQQLAAEVNSLEPTGPTGLAAAVPATGENDNYNADGLFNSTIGVVVLSPTGACNITGFQAGYDGQIAIFVCATPVLCVFNALNAGSLSANQFLMPADLTLALNNAQAFKYFVALAKWVWL